MPESFLSRLSARNQSLLFILLMLVLCYLIYLYYLRPLRQDLDRLRSEEQGMSQQLRQTEELRKRLPKFRLQVKEHEQTLNQLRAVLPERKRTAAIIRQVQDMASDSNLRIKKFVPQRSVPKDFYEDWPIVLDVEGNYDNLGHFFQRVSQSTRLINVNNISIEGLTEDQTRDRTLSATCTATTFVLVEKNAAAAENEGS